MRYRTTKKELEDELLHLEVDCDILRHRIAIREAEETVEAQGIGPDHEDYYFEVEMETDRLLDEELEWKIKKWEKEMRREEKSCYCHEKKR